MMKRTFWLALFILVLVNVDVVAQVTAIKAGKLVVPETGATLNNQIILVEGARIKAVGADVQIPAGADSAAGPLRLSRPHGISHQPKGAREGLALLLRFNAH
jgi:hypothetical protein